ncbi:gluconate 2-dehydrogenase subunit 3 family protein [Alteromonas gilva]|uniref:Gluconate 2-dehydrogenase subunit 3 family protein n=1 Tax=Alteromonas gilva TaxID=2987522 RepID=A0ABT5L1S7_9ALTE|nr:gluconate 2-dehydrogenase subunit 3 family protein [Alteromonas gilva]MDC8829822.1 gluconate 2-dehydrogenase subunit 3 family protein [Alteromonas gilva]
MERRDILKMIATATGAAFVGGNAMAWGTKVPATSPQAAGFSDDDLSLMSEIAETIVPRTDTPGAKDAKCAAMMAVFVADCYTPVQQQTFKDGLTKIDQASMKQFDAPFLALSKVQRHELLSALDQQAKAHNAEYGIWGAATQKPSSRDADDTGPVPHYFTLMKQLTLYSFFTSEVGATKVLRYVGIPGKFDGDMPYEKGDRAWAT